jgi:amino acid adenylation domain-containing protein
MTDGWQPNSDAKAARGLGFLRQIVVGADTRRTSSSGGILRRHRLATLASKAFSPALSPHCQAGGLFSSVWPMSTMPKSASVVGLTVRQERVWSAIHATYEAVPPLVRAVRISGRLDLAAISDAVTAGARDFAEFHTALVEDAAGNPLLLNISTAAPALMPVTRHDDMAARVREEAGRPFGPSDPTMARLRLFLIAPRSALLLLVLNPIVGEPARADVIIAGLAAAIVGDDAIAAPRPTASDSAPTVVGLPHGAVRSGSAPIELSAEATARLAAHAREMSVSIEDMAATVLAAMAARWFHRDRITLARPDDGWFDMVTFAHQPSVVLASAVAAVRRLVPIEKDAFPSAESVLVTRREWVCRESAGLLVATELLPPGRQYAAVELALTVGDRLRAILSVRYDLLPEYRVRLAAEAVSRCLTAIGEGGAATVGALEVAPPDDARRTLAFARSEAAPPAPDLLLHQLFEHQVVRTPDAIAVIAEEELTYRELDTRADLLARRLVGEGVRPGDMVALSMRRSSRLVVASLAVLKAGAAFMPLVTELPAERLALIVDDCDPRLIVTEEMADRRFPESTAERVRPWATLMEQSAPLGVITAQTYPDDLAYVVYTSGSTGRPKGVMVRHRSLVSRIMTDSYEPTVAGERYLLTTAPSFMDSNWETFTPLSSGGAIVIPTDDEARDAWRTVELAAAHRVRRLVIVPSLLAAILDLPESVVSTLREVRWCICSGEPLPQEVLDLAVRMLPNTRVVNVYGLSETWDVCWAEVTKAEVAKVIGRPMPHAELYVLDNDLNQPPLGSLGELYVGGNGLARGYLRRATLTAERFVPSPFGPSGSRLYRTGDLVRWLDDGNLEFIGRIDRQVKIRGFRLELDEVEAALRAILGFEAVVIFESGAEPRLVAYLAAPEAERIDASARRELLSPHLPDYMIPSVVVWLDAFPLTANGKINRLALPSAGTRAAPAYRPARSDLERCLIRCLRRELGDINLGVDDEIDVARLGVLGAARLRADIRSAAGAELPVADLMAASTVAQLAARLEAGV